MKFEYKKGVRVSNYSLSDKILRGVFNAVKFTVVTGVILYVGSTATNAFFGTNDGLLFFKDRSINEVSVLAERNMQSKFKGVTDIFEPLTTNNITYTNEIGRFFENYEKDKEQLIKDLQHLKRSNAEIEQMIENQRNNR